MLRPPPLPRSAPRRFPVSETPPGSLGCEFLPLLGAGTGLGWAGLALGLGQDWDRDWDRTGTQIRADLLLGQKQGLKLAEMGLEQGLGLCWCWDRCWDWG